MLTQKTINYIVWRVENDLPDLFKRIPKNNKKYPDERADYRRMILSDKLESFNIEYKDTLIKLIEQKHELEVEQMIFGILGINK